VPTGVFEELIENVPDSDSDSIPLTVTVFDTDAEDDTDDEGLIDIKADCVFETDGLILFFEVPVITVEPVIDLLDDTLAVTELDAVNDFVVEMLPVSVFVTVELLLFETVELIVFESVDVFVPVELPVNIAELLVVFELVGVTDDEPDIVIYPVSVTDILAEELTECEYTFDAETDVEIVGDSEELPEIDTDSESL